MRGTETVRVIYCLLLIFFIDLGLARAAAPTTKLHVFRQLFAGEEKKTFTEKNPGVGLEMAVTTKESVFNYFSKGRFTSITGKQKFDDDGTDRESKFTFYQSTFELGGTFYPLVRKSRGINIYLGASGLVSYNYMALESEDFTKIKPTYQAVSFGYAGLMGLEWFLFDSSDWCISLEFSQRYETLKLVEQSKFELSGFNISFGFAW